MNICIHYCTGFPLVLYHGLSLDTHLNRNENSIYILPPFLFKLVGWTEMIKFQQSLWIDWLVFMICLRFLAKMSTNLNFILKLSDPTLLEVMLLVFKWCPGIGKPNSLSFLKYFWTLLQTCVVVLFPVKSKLFRL